MSKSWKRAELEVAKLLGAIRRSRYSYSESVEDVLNCTFVVEVKWGKQIPKYVVRDEPAIINEKFVVFSTQHISKHNWLKLKKCTIKRIKFIEDGMIQAEGYNKDKVPLLALKPKNYRGIVLCLRLCDYTNYLGEILKRLHEVSYEYKSDWGRDVVAKL